MTVRSSFLIAVYLELPTERRVRGENDPFLIAILLELEGRQARVHLDLIRRRDDRRFLQENLEQCHREVRHSDGADLPRSQELLHIPPGLDIRWAFAVRDHLVVLSVGLGPVDEVQIDIVDADLVERFLQGLGDFMVVMVRKLGREEDLFARDTRLAERLSDLLLVRIPVRL